MSVTNSNKVGMVIAGANRPLACALAGSCSHRLGATDHRIMIILMRSSLWSAQQNGGGEVEETFPSGL
jgi:hypothetical protein